MIFFFMDILFAITLMIIFAVIGLSTNKDKEESMCVKFCSEYHRPVAIDTQEVCICQK
jgi:hypothetical protein